MFFRYKRRKDESVPVNSSSKNNKSQNSQNNQVTDLHNGGNIESGNQLKELHTAKSEQNIIRNITTPVHKNKASNSLIMVDNQIYSSSTDTNNDISMVDNERYFSVNNDSPVMVENEIYMET